MSEKEQALEEHFLLHNKDFFFVFPTALNLLPPKRLAAARKNTRRKNREKRKKIYLFICFPPHSTSSPHRDRPQQAAPGRPRNPPSSEDTPRESQICKHNIMKCVQSWILVWGRILLETSSPELYNDCTVQCTWIQCKSSYCSKNVIQLADNHPGLPSLFL